MLKKVWLVGLLAVSVGASAQQPDLAPPAEMKKLEYMIGEWSGKVKWSMPGMDATEEEMSYKNEWEGQFMKSTSRITMGGQTMTELAMLGWNAKTKKYDGWTFTNFSPTPRIEHGEIVGDKMTLVSEPWDVMGMAMTSRASMAKRSDDEVQFVLEFKMGEDWQKVAEGTFRKKKR